MCRAGYTQTRPNTPKHPHLAAPPARVYRNPPPAMTSRRLPYPAAVILVAALYFAAARVGLLAAVAQKVVSSAWPPAGFALAVLVLFGPRLWPGVALGALLLNATSGVSLWGAAGIAVGNTLEAVLGAWLLRGARGFEPELERLRDVLALAGAAVAASVASATIGVASLWASGAIAGSAVARLWPVWWSGDAMGILLLAPFLFTWAEAVRRPPPWTWRKTVEAVALGLALVLLTSLVFRTRLTYVYAVFPLVVWAALRFGTRGAATSAVLVAVLTVAYTLRGVGPFVDLTPTQNLALLQLFLTVVSGTGLVLGAVMKERLRAERAAGETEQRFRLLVESVQDYAVVMLDPHGRVTSWNDGAARITGYPAEEIIGRNFSCFYTPAEAASGKPEENLRTAAQGSFVEEGWRVRRDGSRFWASVAIAPVRDPTGALLGFAKVTRDLTEQRRAGEERREREELLRAVFDRTAVGIAITDLGGRFVQTNHVYEAMLGYTADELRERTFLELTHEADRASNAALTMDLLEGRRNAFRLEKRYRCKDGHAIWVRNTVSLIAGDDGRPRLLIAIVEDITERKRAEDELYVSRRELQALSHGLLEAQELERTRIARDLHDSIGQALTAVKLTLETRQRAAADGALLDSVHVIERAIDDVRSLSFELRPALLDDLGLPSALGAFARRQADRAGLELALAVAPVTRAIPRATATACFRIAQEAVTNVVRHARARRLDVALEATGNTLGLVVRDDGVGFPPPVPGAPVESHLGLLGMQERAQLVGGDVRIESRPGVGTTVRARFPLREGPDAA